MGLPEYAVRVERPRRRVYALQVAALLCAVLLYAFVPALYRGWTVARAEHSARSAHVLDALQQCRYTHARAGPPPDFSARTVNERYEAGTPAVVVANANVWTGDEVLRGYDVRLENGLITAIARAGELPSAPLEPEHVIDAHGERWLTPGIVDVHTHLGVYSMPILKSTMDGNSMQGPVQPYLRSFHGFNDHDLALRLTQAGGVTTALVLPGSLNNIGGQAYPIKLRPMRGEAASARILDAPRTFVLPGDAEDGRDARYAPESGMHRPDSSSAFRHMKMACGENARQYGLVRMDEAYLFRSQFTRARTLRERQDAFCADLERDPLRTDRPVFPNELELEALVDLLRGKVKLQTHCYTVNDLDAMVRHANEFKFPIAAFHHAHETFLVPETLRKSYGGTPAVAMFSTNANYKYESYFGTPFAGALLKSHNITPLYKSDHPVLDSRRVLTQAQQAHHFGLDEEAALKAVTSEAAKVLGLDHRVGYIRVGHDADVVLWDRHPLQLGATPLQVYVDGIAQLDASALMQERNGSDTAPQSADYSAAIDRVRSDTNSIIAQRTKAFPSVQRHVDTAVFEHVGKILHRSGDGARRVESIEYRDSTGMAVYSGGRAVCLGNREKCSGMVPPGAERVDLHGGVIAPGIIAYGSTLGLSDIPSEASASDGELQQPSYEEQLDVSRLTQRPIPRAADALTWGGNDLLRAHASGATTALNYPDYRGEFASVSSHFDTGASNVLDAASVRVEDTAVHVSFEHSGKNGPPLSEQVRLLRTLLERAGDEAPSDSVWRQVRGSKLPLVVEASSVAQMAQLVLLKKRFRDVRLVIESRGPTHALAPELAAHNIAVILPTRVWALDWDVAQRLPGPPLSTDTELGVLLKHGVRVAVGIAEAWEASNLLWETHSALMDANVTFDDRDVFSLLTTALEDALGLPEPPSGDFVAYDVCRARTSTLTPQGDPTTYGSKVIAVGTPRAVGLVS